MNQDSNDQWRLISTKWFTDSITRIFSQKTLSWKIRWNWQRLFHESLPICSLEWLLWQNFQGFILLFLQVSGFCFIGTQILTGASQLGLIKGFIETKKSLKHRGEKHARHRKKALLVPFPKEGAVVTTTLTKRKLRSTGTKNYGTWLPHQNNAWKWGHEAHAVQQHRKEWRPTEWQLLELLRWKGLETGLDDLGWEGQPRWWCYPGGMSKYHTGPCHGAWDACPEPTRSCELSGCQPVPYWPDHSDRA